MYDILKSVISAGDYKLAEIQHKIKKLFALGDLTEEQLDELVALSQKNAVADAERPEILQMLRRISDRVAALEGNATPDSGDEHEIWTPWDGISDQYQPGAIVSHNGKLWKSTFAGQNVWEPGAVGTESLWLEV